MSIFQDFGCNGFSDALENYAGHWGIHDPQDQARFLGQLSVESAKFTRVVENLNYRAQRLLDLFLGRNGLETLDQATVICAGGPDSVAKAIYGMPWGSKLGNRSDDDAVAFPGRGLIMLTGYANYHDASFGCFGDDRLLTNPKSLTIPDVAANVACWFWYSKKLSIITDIPSITRKVNGGLTDLQGRIDETNRALSLLGQG